MAKNHIVYAFLKQDQKEIKLSQETTIGRGSNNIIKIPDHTVSKNHAVIIYVKTHHSSQQISQKCFISDLNSVNGTYVNGIKLENDEKQLLRHQDALQFGKYEALYTFFQRYPKPQKLPTKINLKDYYYDVPDHQIAKTTNNFLPKHQHEYSDNAIPLHETGRPKSASKIKPKEGRVKIPDLSEFLTVKNPLEEQKSVKGEPSKLLTKNLQYDTQSEKKKKKQDKINFAELSNFFTSNTQQLEKDAQMNIYLREQQALKKQEERRRKIQQDRLKAQIEKTKQQELLLRKQQQMEKKIRQEEEKLNDERRRVEEQILFRAKQREQQEQKMKEEAERKEQQYLEKLRRQKEKQIADIKEKQEQARINQQKQLKEGYEKKKRQLQIEAEALAKQYQNIYKETIQKVKNNIEKQQKEIQTLEESIDKFTVQSHKLKQCIQSKTQLAEQLKRQYLSVNSKNKALLLYASELQNRIDQLKTTSNPKADGLRTKHKLNRNQQVKDSIIHSRKLLQIKQNEAKNLQIQLKKLKTILISNNLMSGSMSYLPEKVQDYLETVLQNSESISTLKEEYYQFVQQQKNLQDLWQQELQSHNQVQELQRSHQIQIANNVKAIEENLRDNLKKICEQRLGMLKIVQPTLNEQKRKAAKFLIEQIVEIENEIINLYINNEQSHLKIGKIIMESQGLKKQNTYLSELLFGEGTAHHLDNMKTIINELIDKIQTYKQGGSVTNCLKLSNEILNTQRNIQEQLEKNKFLKAQQIKYIHSGMANKIISLEQGSSNSKNNKNPITFFSQILLKKDNQISHRQQNIKKTKIQIENIIREINALQQKKDQMNSAFEQYKRKQMEEARTWMMN